MTLRYEYSAHKTSSSSCFDQNGSESFSKARTIMRVLREYALSILNFPIFSGHKQTSEQEYLSEDVLFVILNKI
jgi:uncharacterized protein (DUF2225 family)